MIESSEGRKIAIFPRKKSNLRRSYDKQLHARVYTTDRVEIVIHKATAASGSNKKVS